LIFCLAVNLSSCKRQDLDKNPQGNFDRIKLEFLHGHLVQAQQQAELAYRHFSATSPEWAWRFRLLTSEILINRGLSQDALTLLNNQPSLDSTQNDLQIRRDLLEGFAYMALNRPQLAEERLQRAENLSQAARPNITAEVLAGRGILEIRRGQLPTAEQYFRKALQLAHASNDRFVEAATLLNLGSVSLRQLHYDDSIDWSNRAYEMAHSIDAGITEEKALGNLGWSYYKMGDFDRSLSLTLDAEKRSRDLAIMKDQARWVYNTGVIYYEQSQLALAGDHFQRSLNLAKELGDTDQITNALSSLAFLSFRQEQFEAAKNYSQQVFTLAHEQGDRPRELYALFTQAQVAVKAGDDRQAEKLFTEIAQDGQTESPLRWQAQDELAHVYERKNRPETAEQHYQSALATIECARDSLRNEEFRLPFLTNAADVYGDYIQFLVKDGKKERALKVADYGRAQTLAEGLGLVKNKTNCSARPNGSFDPKIAAAKAGATILFYWIGHNQSYEWIVDKKQISIVNLPPAHEIETAIGQYRKSLLGADDVLQSGGHIGSDLYKSLIEPAQPLIRNDSRLVIIPDQSLNNLNFETLLVPGPKLHYWIEDVTISYASSLRVLAAKRPSAHTSQGRLMLIGDPVVPDAKYPSLPEAATEIEKVEASFPQRLVQVYKREAATPLAYLNNKPEQYSYIHFVAHGTASQLSPLDSAIVLSKATVEEDSFKLHARDIIGHPLNADLVTISACYGSGSTVYNGEGLVGLAWGFVRAGAHGVVGALWAVSDKSTSQLMAQVYSELRKGRRPEDALRDAKLTLLHSDTIFRKPIYWAPFQFYMGY